MDPLVHRAGTVGAIRLVLFQQRYPWTCHRGREDVEVDGKADQPLKRWPEQTRSDAMTKQAIFFDIDGTLVDSNEAHVDAWCEAFAREGYRFRRADIHEQVGKGGDNLLPS